MSFLHTLRAWFGVAPSGTHVHMPAHAASPLNPGAELGSLLPQFPTFATQRYSDANYVVSRSEEARKMAVMSRICAVNNAAAEDVIDRKGTTVRPASPSHYAARLTAQELHDAETLAEVTYVMEKNHDPRR